MIFLGGCAGGGGGGGGGGMNANSFLIFLGIMRIQTAESKLQALGFRG